MMDQRWPQNAPRMSFGFALLARRSKNARAVSITPTFSATAADD